MVQQLPDPLSRKDLQRLTRERLIFTARAEFAREGYHGAKLNTIASEAGFSKGAVYSNFGNKAELFLAVLDANIAAVVDNPRLVNAGPSDLAEHVNDRDTGQSDAAARGFGLATLEFVAMAARDSELRKETRKRIDFVVRAFAQVVESIGARSSNMTSQELGALVFALDQGAAMMTLAGSTAVTDQALDKGIAGLLGMPVAGGSDDPGDGSASITERSWKILQPSNSRKQTRVRPS